MHTCLCAAISAVWDRTRLKFKFLSHDCIREKLLSQMPCQIFVQHLLIEAVRSSTRGIIKKKPTEIPSKEVAMQTAVCHWLWPQGIGFPYSDGNTLWVDWSCPPPPCGRARNCTRQQQSCRLFSYVASTTVAVQVIDVFRMCLADAPFKHFVPAALQDATGSWMLALYALLDDFFTHPPPKEMCSSRT